MRNHKSEKLDRSHHWLRSFIYVRTLAYDCVFPTDSSVIAFFMQMSVRIAHTLVVAEYPAANTGKVLHVSHGNVANCDRRQCVTASTGCHGRPLLTSEQAN